MENLHISEFWMPAFIGAFAFPLLSLLGWLMTRLPQPTEEDKKLRTERVTLNREGRMHIFKSFMPVLLLLFFANLFITVLQDIKEDFLVKIINVEASGLSSWAFAKIDAIVTLVILFVFGIMSWLFLQSLSLYTVYLSFQTLFFERFIACFRIRGNVGFFIITLDFIGYMGTVLVLVLKECFKPNIDWLHFYNLMSGYVGVTCAMAFMGALVYLLARYRRERTVCVGKNRLFITQNCFGLSPKIANTQQVK